MMNCISGCTVRGSHLPTCTTTTCTGCLPRKATIGKLCQWCLQRLTAAVVDIPELFRHLQTWETPILSSPAGNTGGGGSQPGSKVLYPGSLADSEELIGICMSWVEYIIDQHPENLEGPTARGFEVTRASVRVVDDEIFSISPQVVRGNVDAVDRMVKWLLPHLSWVAGQSWAGEMRTELDSMVSTLWARYPREERAHWVPMPCPKCNSRSLAYWPPYDVGLPPMVQCTVVECGAQWVGDSWTRMVEYVLDNPDLGLDGKVS